MLSTKHIGSGIFFLLSFMLTGIITGCSTNPPFKSRTVNVTSGTQLTEQEVLDIDPLADITEHDIQQAIKDANKNNLHIAYNTHVVLVQSGATIPDTTMQQEMMKYYNVSIYSGISPTKPRSPIARQAEEQRLLPQSNYIKSLRLASARAKQDKIIVYWGSFELGLVDKKDSTIVWVPYSNDNIIKDTKKLRYSIRFAVVDVKTGMWAMYTPPNIEVDFVNVILQSNRDKLKQITNVKDQAYETAARDFSRRFNKIN